MRKPTKGLRFSKKFCCPTSSIAGIGHRVSGFGEHQTPLMQSGPIPDFAFRYPIPCTRYPTMKHFLNIHGQTTETVLHLLSEAARLKAAHERGDVIATLRQK